MNLVIRADASASVGSGHVMRCLALAQAWRDAGRRATFVTAMEAPGLEARLESEGIEVVHLSARPGSADDAIQTAAFAREAAANWVVVDGYFFDGGYQRAVKNAGFSLLAIDDTVHLPHYYADIVLNQNIDAEALRYSCEPRTRLLLGTRYALLRREFLKWRRWKREVPGVARKVLVTLGGSDPDNATFKVFEALQQLEIDGVEAAIVAGASNPNFCRLRSAVGASRLPVRLETNVTDMPDLMAWADAAVSAGGSTSWELAFMGVPLLVLILADNQRLVARGLEKAGIARNLGPPEDVSSGEIARTLTRLLSAAEERVEMSQRGRRLVDGEGAARVLARIDRKPLTLREVEEGDCSLLWHWANDREVRAVSFSSEPIPWETHLQWFKTRLNDPHTFLYIAVDTAGVPAGQVRYELEDDEAVVSVSVDPKYRGQGCGSELLRLGAEKLFQVSEVSVVHAYVKPENEASTRTFIKAGFRNAGMTDIKGHRAVHMILARGEATCRAL